MDPVSWKEAMGTPEREGWTLVKKPEGRRLLKHKLVPKGFLQIPGLDFLADETFAPTVSYGNFRFCLAYASSQIERRSLHRPTRNLE